MRYYTWIWFICAALLMGCEDDFDKEETNLSEGIAEGMVSIGFVSDELPAILTRAGEKAAKEEPIENALVMVFKSDVATGDSILVNKAYQQLTVDNKSVNIYLTAQPGQCIYALCNLTETQAEALLEKENDRYTLRELYQELIEIKVPDGAYSGKYVMSGSTPLTLISGDRLSREYTVPIKRLTAQLNFEIFFDPIEPTDQFTLAEIYIHCVPRGSMILDGGGSTQIEGSWGYHHDTPHTDSLDICPNDYAYVKAGNDPAAEKRSQHYFEDIWLDYTTEKRADGTEYYQTSFQMFENRQGAVYDDPANWEELQSMINQPPHPEVGDMYRYYQQGKKRGFVGTDPDGQDKIFDRQTKPNTDLYTVNQAEKGFPCATYLTIRGVYTQKSDLGVDNAKDVTYHIYLGADNYRDFNICRNHLYSYQISIRAEDQTDTRVDSSPIGGITLFGNSDRILDAHPDVMQLLIYSPRDWTIRVKDPDQTPWLELSDSPTYRPRLVGEGQKGRASFQLSGKAGLHYIYVHVDEYIPERKSPTEQNHDSLKPRDGWIVCENGTSNVIEKRIRQHQAQMVICHIKYDIHSMTEIRDTFFVERILEKKNLSWGFHYYWSFIMDDRIAAGQWDGLANTCYMYRTGLDGDKWGVEPAYPDGIPLTDALGYALAKNRDRNGNGKIDYNEILWYWPAANELQALSGHMNGGSKYYDEEFVKTVTMDWQDEPMNFHSSSPSSADPEGITPGFCYSVLLSPNVKKSGKKSIVPRSRLYNVICARRASGWMGPATGEVEGDIEADENWEIDDEVIMDKKK